LNHIVRVTKLEKAKVIRKLIIGANLQEAPKTDEKLLSEINAIGVNVNQIARVANTCGYVGDIHIGLLQQEIESLKKKVGDEIGDYKDLCG